MKNLIITISLGFVLSSCNQKLKNSNSEAKSTSEKTASEKKEHSDEENDTGSEAILKEIVKRDGVYFVSFDNVEVEYLSPNNDGNLEIKIINHDPNIKTLEVSSSVIIQNENCENISAESLFRIKEHVKKLPKVSYTLKNGRVENINIT